MSEGSEIIHRRLSKGSGRLHKEKGILVKMKEACRRHIQFGRNIRVDRLRRPSDHLAIYCQTVRSNAFGRVDFYDLRLKSRSRGGPGAPPTGSYLIHYQMTAIGLGLNPWSSPGAYTFDNAVGSLGSVANNLVWLLLTGSIELRDPPRAVELLEAANRTRALDFNSRNTMAIGHYRIGRYEEAVKLLRQNLNSQPDVYLAYDLYFVAMCYWQLDEHERARETLACGERMGRLRLPTDLNSVKVLEVFRREAQEFIRGFVSDRSLRVMANTPQSRREASLKSD